jgi:release factor glutamine methyltransferase
VTTAYTDLRELVLTAVGVYAPQQDSELLVDALEKTGLAPGRRIVDLCTGSGVVAISAFERGASAVTAFDICPRAVRCARVNALAAGAEVDVHLGSWARALEFGPFDIVLSNPPYVPHDPDDHPGSFPSAAGPARACNAGPDGRLVLDPLCVAAPDLIADNGTMLLVQSEFAGVEQTLMSLRSTGLRAKAIACQYIPFGPVMSSRARWLEGTGRLQSGRREEELVVIRADKP